MCYQFPSVTPEAEEKAGRKLSSTNLVPLPEFYAAEGELVENDLSDSRLIESALLGPLAGEPKKDFFKRNLIRHDSKKLAQELMKIVDHL